MVWHPTFRLVRPDDLLVIDVVTEGLEPRPTNGPRGSARFELHPRGGAGLLRLRLPPQQLLEHAADDDGDATGAGPPIFTDPSEVVFEVTADDPPIPTSIEGILDAARRLPVVVAEPTSDPDEPAPTAGPSGTRFDLPYVLRLRLPKRSLRLVHDTEVAEHDGRVGLWTSEVAIGPDDTGRDRTLTVRFDVLSEASNPATSETAMNHPVTNGVAEDVAERARLTGRVEVNDLRVSSLGGWAGLCGRSPEPSRGPGPTGFTHRLSMGRDEAPRRATTGTLPPFGPRSHPTAPVVRSVVPTFEWSRTLADGSYTSHRSTKGVRVSLERPWRARGAGERLGVVVFRSSVEAGSPDGHKLADLVTRWSHDLLEDAEAGATTHLLANRFTNHREEAVGVPLPGSPAGAPPVTIIGYEVRFDADRNRWFADIDVELPERAWPFLRLAVVRYLPASATGGRFSPVTTTAHVQLPPSRELKARRHGAHGVRATITGDPAANSHFEMRQERRFPDPLDATLDLGSSDGVGTADGWRVVDRTGFGGLADLVLEPVPGFTPSPNLIRELAAGRVVVDEVQTGIALRRESPPATRVVYTETFDRSAVGIAGAPS